MHYFFRIREKGLLTQPPKWIFGRRTLLLRLSGFPLVSTFGVWTVRIPPPQISLLYCVCIMSHLFRFVKYFLLFSNLFRSLSSIFINVIMEFLYSGLSVLNLRISNNNLVCPYIISYTFINIRINFSYMMHILYPLFRLDTIYYTTFSLIVNGFIVFCQAHSLFIQCNVCDVGHSGIFIFIPLYTMLFAVFYSHFIYKLFT